MSTLAVSDVRFPFVCILFFYVQLAGPESKLGIFFSLCLGRVGVKSFMTL